MENEIKDGLISMRVEFADSDIDKLPKPTKSGNEKGKCLLCKGFHGLPAVHLDYVGHAAMTERLLDVDLFWDWKPFATAEDGLPRFDKNGGLWIWLTILGVTRPGYGDPGRKEGEPDGVKEAIGDAIRNASMRFGCALYLWKKDASRDIGYVDKDGKPFAGKKVEGKTSTTASNNSSPPKGSKEKPRFDGSFKGHLKRMESAKKHIGEDSYYGVLGAEGFEHANEIKELLVQKKVYQLMLDLAADQASEGKNDAK